MAAAQPVTVIRPLTVITASGKPFTIAPGGQATAEWRGWSPELKGGIYYLSGTMYDAAGRLLRCWDGFEPRVRVDRLHRAVAHAEPLYRYCDRCHGLGHDLRQPEYRYVPELGPLAFTPCPVCDGDRTTKVYAANAAV